MSAPFDLQALQRFYFHCADVIDEGRLEEWPALFTETATYRIISKENVDRKLPLALMYCQGMGMLKDRAFASAKLNVYAPRTWRHMISNVVLREEDGRLHGSANVMVLETVTGKTTQILVSGKYVDVLEPCDGGVKLSQRTVIYDAALVDGSVVFPI